MGREWEHLQQIGEIRIDICYLKLLETNSDPRRDLSNPANALEARGNIGSTVGLLEERGIKKFSKAVKGECKKKRSVEQLVKRQDLAELYESIKGDNKVNVGGTKHWKFPGTDAAYTTAEFYGCTIVIVVDGKGAIIGHYNQQSGNCEAMDSASEVKKSITEKLANVLVEADWDQNSMVYIIHTSGAKSVGVQAIEALLTGEGDLPKERIKQHRYLESSGVAEYKGKPKGKAVVQVTPHDDGTTLHLYIESDTPSYTAEYDKNGNLCTETIA